MTKKRMKTVRGTKKQKRPSASYYYNELGKEVGFKTSYRPRKGGKMIKFSLQLRKNGTPFWKALQKLPKKSKRSKRPSKNTKKLKLRSSIIKKSRSSHSLSGGWPAMRSYKSGSQSGGWGMSRGSFKSGSQSGGGGGLDGVSSWGS